MTEPTIITTEKGTYTIYESSIYFDDEKLISFNMAYFDLSKDKKRVFIRYRLDGEIIGSFMIR